MSFNYLQTDDRDDYFAQFSNPRPRKFKPATQYIIINQKDEPIFSGTSRECGQFVKEHFHLTARWAKKGRWRDALKANYYTFENFRQESQTPPEDINKQEGEKK